MKNIKMVIDCMENQQVLINEILQTGKYLGDALYSKNWPLLEKNMSLFSGLMDNFENMEKQRKNLLDSMECKSSKDFEAILNNENLPKFQKLKFELRAGLTKVEAWADFFRKYTQFRLESNAEFVECVRKLTASTGYNSRGLHPNTANSKPFMVSHKS